MKKLDIKKITNHLDCSEEEFANDMGISMEQMQEFCNGAPMPQELLENILAVTGLPLNGIYVMESETKFSATNINPQNTFEASQDARASLVDYIKQGLDEISEENVHNEILKIDSCVKTLRKPRISFAGQSDTGKSTLINALLGAEKMPAKWTPTTSIVVYIKHIDDRPTFMNEDVWIFGSNNDTQWNDIYLDDEAYCNKFLIKKGDYSLLSTFGTHQNEQKNQKIATSAVAFIDSPLLKNCDILDLPGFGATAEDDALHKFNTQDNVTDILLYLSRSNGFLQDRDLDYLRECIKSLRPAEQKGQNNIKKLENLFIIASQSGAVNNGNSTELKEILDRRCKALCDTYAAASETNKPDTLLPLRTQLTGYHYNESDFRSRFFTYEKDMPRLCKQFNSAFTSLAEDLPKAMYGDFSKNLKKIVSASKDIIQKRVTEWENILKNKTKYVELVREIKEKEPARKALQLSKNKEMYSLINTYCTETQQEIHSMYTETMTVDNLVELIERYDIKNKKESKQDFASMINERLSNKIQKIISEKASLYTENLNDFLDECSKSFTDYSIDNEIKVNFDAINSFALGLTGLTALGASAAWLSTSFTAWSVFTFGSLAGWGSIIAVGGAIGIAVSALIAGVVALVKAITWKKDLAKSIIKAYNQNDYIDKINDDVKLYWDDTKSSFETAIKHIEDDWMKRIEEYESIADEKNIPVLQKKIADAYKGLDFFTKIPMPEIG